MLDIVFSVWMRTGSYPPDSNKYEKKYFLDITCLATCSLINLYNQNIIIFIEKVLMSEFTYKVD